MTRIESNPKVISHNIELIFNFLSNFNNFSNLMPPKVSNWTCTDNSCYFTISGITSLGMRIESKQAPHSIHIINDGKVPFQFTLDIKMEAVSEEKTRIRLIFDAQLNAMLKMVAVKPLKQFLNDLAEELEKIDLKNGII